MNIYLSMLLITIMPLFWYNPIHRLQIQRILRLNMRRWFIPWEMICWRQWKKMVRYVMNLILAVGRNMEWMAILNMCMMPMKKIIDINYKHGYLKQPMSKNIMWRVRKLFIYQRMGKRGCLFRTKGIFPEGKNILQRNWGRIFWWVM